MARNMWIHGARPRTLATAAATILVGFMLGTCQSIILRSRCVAGVSADCGIRYADTLPTPIGSTSHIVTEVPVVEPGPQVGSVTYWIIGFSCLIVALALQVCVNYLNDYSDGIRGVDAHRCRGGQVDTVDQLDQVDKVDHLDKAPSVLQSTPQDNVSHAPVRLVASGVPARAVATAAIVAFGVAAAVGMGVVVLTHRWLLLAVGLLCVFAVWGYTSGKRPYGYAGFGELVVALVYGPVGVWATAYALTGLYPTTVLEALLWLFTALPTGLAAAMVLLVNNMRDITSDAMVDKRTLVVRLGLEKSTRLYIGLMVSSLVAVLLQLGIIIVFDIISGFSGGSVSSLFLEIILFIGFAWAPQLLRDRKWKDLFIFSLLFDIIAALVLSGALLNLTMYLW